MKLSGDTTAASSTAQWLVAALSIFPMFLTLMVMSMLPVVELRGTILLWSAQGDLGITLAGFPFPDAWWKIYIVSVIGNIIPIPFLLTFFPWVEKKLRRWAFFEKFFDKLFHKTKKKASASVERYEELALLLFVAIPLPVTGAWTGTLVAYLFGLDRLKSFIFIFLGVLTAGAVMLILVWKGLLIAAILITVMTLTLVLLGKTGQKDESKA